MNLRYLVSAALACLLAATSAFGQTNLVTLDPNATTDPLNTPWSGGDWNTEGNFSGWTTGNITGATVAAGVLSGTASSTEPAISLTGITGGPDFDLGYNDFLDLRLKLPVDYAGEVKIYYGVLNGGYADGDPGPRNLTGFDASRCFIIPNANLAKDGAAHVYRVNLSLEVWCRGQLNDLRIVPATVSGTAFEIDYVRIGDTGPVPTVQGFKSTDAPYTLQSKNFIFGWNDAAINAVGMNAAWAKLNLRNAEEVWSHHVHKLAYPKPRWQEDDGPYKLNYYCVYSGNFSDTWTMLNVGYYELRTDPPTWTMTHELTHAFQGVLSSGHVPGEYYELHANYGREQWLKHYQALFPNQSGFATAILAEMHMAQPIGRNYYETWQPYLYLDTNPDNLPDVGVGTVGSSYASWREMAEGETSIFQSLKHSLTSTNVKDLIGYYARRGLNYNYPGYEPIKAKIGGIQEWAQLTEPIRRPDAPDWWQVPHQRAPMQAAFTIHELTPSGSGAGRVVSVDLKGLLAEGTGDNWRASLIVMNDAGGERYSTLFGNNQTGSVTLAAEENRVFLVVAATPDDYALYRFDEPQFPYRSDPEKRRFHYEFNVTGATPKERNNGATTGLVQHANGGGWKASTATVASTAYIGPNARVLDTAQVLGNARVEDFAVVRNNARLQDNAIARGHAQVLTNAVIAGNAMIADFARIGGDSRGWPTLSGSARLLEHATFTNGVVTDQAVMKGSSGSWGGTLSGNSIADGDYAFGRDIHNASIAGHKPWVGIPDNWLVPLPTGLYASYEFSTASDTVALDTYAATNGIYRGAPEWLSVDGSRSGVLVLNGADQWIQLERSVADMPSLSLTTWVKWNGGTANQTLFQFGDGGSKFVTFTPSNASGVAELRASDGTNTYNIAAASALPVGTWCQVAVSLDGTTGKFTINGSAAGSGSLPLRPHQFLPPNTAANPAHNFIGRNTAGNFFSGSLDDFKVYSVASPTFLLVSAEAPETIVPENAPNATFRLSRTSLDGSSTSGNLSVNYTISGTATAGADYVAPSGTAVIPDGQSFVDVEIPLLLDEVVEPDETIILTLAASNNYANAGSGRATVTIPNVADISDSMLAWYRFDETSGTTANDSSGKGNHAELINGPVWNPAEMALSFDDANDENDSVQTPVPNGGTRTLSAWFRPRSSTWIQNIWNYNAVFDSDVPGAYGAGWGVVDNKIRVMLDDTMWDTGISVSLNQWQHGILTFDSTRARFYLNGVLQGSFSYGQGGVTTATYTIGSKAFDGQIRDAKILNRVVYSDEAMQLYQSGAPQGAPLNLTALAGHGSVTLGWQPANAGETGHIVRRATITGGPYTDIATVTGTSFVDATVTNGSTYYYVVAGVNMGSPGPDSNGASATPAAGSALPPPWQHGNVGTAAGSPTTVFSGGQVTVSGAGVQIRSGTNSGGSASDSFRYVYIPVVGDCTITARLVSLSGTNTARRAGVMIRENLTAGSLHASTLITPASTNNRTFVRRTTADNNASATSATRTHMWLRIMRTGTTFSSFTSADGVSWSQLGTNQTVSMSSTAVYYVGLAVCSGSTSVASTAVFSNVSITGGFPTGLAATAGDAQVFLSWNGVTGATSYRVKRATTPGGPYALIASPTTNSFTDTTAANGTTYYYVVSAHNGTSESANSAEVFATPVLLRTELVWNNSAGTGVWSSTDANWTGFPWIANLDATMAHTATAQSILLAESTSADEVVIGKGTNNANYTLQGNAGATLSAAAMTVQGNINNDPGLGAAALSNLNAQIASDLRVGRWDLLIGGSSTVNITGQLRSTSDGSGAGDWGRVTLQDTANVTATGGVNGAGSVWGLTLNGGTLTTPSIRAAENAYGNGARLTLNGTTIRATQPTGNFITVDSTSQAYLGTNGARFDTNGNDITVGVKLIDVSGQNGTLAKLGGGMLTLTAANTLTGNADVLGGTLYANPGNAANNRALSYVSGVTVQDGATLRTGPNGLFGWDGTQEKPITVHAGGTLTADTGADVGVGTVTLAGGTLANFGASSNWGSWRFDNATDVLRATENSTVSAVNVKFANGGSVDVAAGKTLDFSGTITNASSGGVSSLVKTGAGTLLLSGPNNYTGPTTVRSGTLNLTGSIAGGGDLIVADAGAGALMSNAGTLNRNAVTLGAGTDSVGGLTQSAGSTTASFLHLGLTPGSYGALKVDGGTFTVNGDANVGSWGSGYQTGGGLGGLVDISSGTVNVTGWITMGRWGATQDAVLHVSGGNLTYGGGGLVGNWNADGADTSVITVAGNGSIATTNDTVINLSNNSSSANTGILNLNGGTVTPTRVIGSRGFVNFNGGTLRAYSAQTNFLAVNSAFVRSGGAVIDSNDKAITISQALLAPTDSGVTTVSVIDGGSGYTCAPIVKIVGGTSSVPATAVADMVDDGTGAGTFKIAGLTITSPGVYTAAPTSVTLIGGGSATPAIFGTPVLAANTSGPLTKNGPGTLTLTATNTYTGGTNVNSGTVTLSGNSATLGSGDLTIATGATCAIANPNGAVANSATVSLHGTAKLDLASGVNETVRFLTLNGVLQPAGTYLASNLPAHISGSGSLIVTEGTAALTPAETWRDAHFGTTSNTGNAADNADPDGDGSNNLLERALGTNPLVSDSSGRPTIDTATPGFSFTFTHSRAATDLTLVVEVATDLQPASWREALLAPAPNADGTLSTTDDTRPDVRIQRFTASTSASRMFYRLRLR